MGILIFDFEIVDIGQFRLDVELEDQILLVQEEIFVVLAQVALVSSHSVDVNREHRVVLLTLQLGRSSMERKVIRFWSYSVLM